MSHLQFLTLKDLNHTSFKTAEFLCEFCWVFSEFEIAISMLLCRALHTGLLLNPLFHSKQEPHQGLYSVRTCAHPKKCTFVHNLLKTDLQIQICWDSQQISPKFCWFSKSLLKNTTFMLMIGNCKTCRTTPK